MSSRCKSPKTNQNDTLNQSLSSCMSISFVSDDSFSNKNNAPKNQIFHPNDK